MNIRDLLPKIFANRLPVCITSPSTLLSFPGYVLPHPCVTFTQSYKPVMLNPKLSFRFCCWVGLGWAEIKKMTHDQLCA